MYLSPSVENNHSEVSASRVCWDALGSDLWSRFVGRRLAREDNGGGKPHPTFVVKSLDFISNHNLW